ncbi:MAG: signal transduction histidine kinase [bacterium]|jgi:signal transduction histidine kinase
MQQNRNCQVEVIDFGIGIPKDKLKSLFQTFYRCENVGDISGTGLGLTIVKDYVSFNDGEVEVESELGKRTKFTVTPPFKHVQQVQIL